MKRCDIIIPVWNEPEITRECIDSIIRHTDYPYRLVIIDNGSDDKTGCYLEGLKNTKVARVLLIRNDRNLGYIKAVNEGIRASDAPYLCLLNNDTVVTDGWLDEMIEAAETHPSIGIVNPSSNTSGQFPGRKEFNGEVQELSTARGFCMLMKRGVVDSIGLFDEAYSMGYFEETDYSRKARNAGFGIARVKSSYVWHKGSVTFKRIVERDALFKKNERIFFTRWGRPVRIGLFLDTVNSKRDIDRLARDVTKDGHQLLIFLKRGLPWPVGFDHYEIRRVDLNSLFFSPVSVYKIFSRRVKKKIDVVITDNEIMGRLFEITRGFHGSTVLVGPNDEDLKAVLSAKSKDF